MTSSAPKSDQDCLGRSVSCLRHSLASAACTPLQPSDLLSSLLSVVRNELRPRFRPSLRDHAKFIHFTDPLPHDVVFYVHHRQSTNSSNYLAALHCRRLRTFTGPRPDNLLAAHSIHSLYIRSHLAAHIISLRTMILHCIDALLLRPTSLSTDLYSSHAIAPLRAFEQSSHFSHTIFLPCSHSPPLRKVRAPSKHHLPFKETRSFVFSLYFFRAIPDTPLNFSPNVLAFQFAFQSPLFHSRHRIYSTERLAATPQRTSALRFYLYHESTQKRIEEVLQEDPQQENTKRGRVELQAFPTGSFTLGRSHRTHPPYYSPSHRQPR